MSRALSAIRPQEFQLVAVTGRPDSAPRRARGSPDRKQVVRGCFVTPSGYRTLGLPKRHVVPRGVTDDRGWAGLSQPVVDPRRGRSNASGQGSHDPVDQRRIAEREDVEHDVTLDVEGEAESRGPGLEHLLATDGGLL